MFQFTSAGYSLQFAEPHISLEIIQVSLLSRVLTISQYFALRKRLHLHPPQKSLSNPPPQAISQQPGACGHHRFTPSPQSIHPSIK